jgi:hypothetical protein
MGHVQAPPALQAIIPTGLDAPVSETLPKAILRIVQELPPELFPVHFQLTSWSERRRRSGKRWK